MTPTLRVASTSMRGMHAHLSIPLAFKIEEVILTLGPRGLYLVWTWSHHDQPLHSLSPKIFPQMAPIVRAQFGAQA